MEQSDLSDLKQSGYRVAVLGDRDSVLGFLALGYAVYEAADPIEAERILRMLCADRSFAVIFLTEGLAPHLTHITDKFKGAPLPAIVTIPQADGLGQGYGMDSLHRAVERAVGADILS